MFKKLIIKLYSKQYFLFLLFLTCSLKCTLKYIELIEFIKNI